MQQYSQSRLIQLFHERALKFGDFTLASGKKSSYYLDGKQITLQAEGLRLVCLGLWDLLADLEFDAIGGLTMGADPIVGGVLTVAAERGRALTGVLIRKEPKGHGTQRFLEGPVRPGDRVVVIDDVVTTAGSALQAVDRLQEFGAKVVCVVGVVDRHEGGMANVTARGLPLRTLLSITDFGLPAPDVA
jgi:orotate phosphoribosyltransferase